MRALTAMISLDEATRRLSAAASPMTRTEIVTLEHATGRVAASDLTAPHDVPPFARAAMDGYAVVAADTANASAERPVRLRVIDRVFTAEVSRRTVAPGTCVEVATGAPLPQGAEAVVMVEDTRLAGDGVVEILAPTSSGRHIGRQGADIAAGSTVVFGGNLLTPARVGAVAATGRARVEVYAKPRVALLSTGDEIVAPGRALRPGQIYDTNRFALTGLVEAHGGIAEAHEPVSDTIEALTRGLDACANADVMVFSGGTSVGTRDLVLDVISARGTVVFHGIDIKPGKPTAFAIVDGRPFFGMPGYPTSCLLIGYLMLVPFLRATARLPPHIPRTVRVPLGQSLASPSGRHTFHTVRIVDGVAWPAFKASGDITSLSEADGYVEIQAGERDLKQDALVLVTLT